MIGSSACSDANREPAASQPANPPPAPEGPAPAASAPDASAEIAQHSASDTAREPDDVAWSGGDPAHGQALYATHCAICHGGGGAGDGIATPALNPKPRDFRDGRFYIDTNGNNHTGEDVDLARVILNGPAAFGGTREMVGWRDALSDRDVRDLIAHIRTLASAAPAAPAGTPAS
jgi:mono/diheme cytochrome c family protein